MRRALITALITLLPSAALAQAAATGSANCSTLVQAAANGLNARVAADDQNIRPPQSVKSLTCLDNFFNGVGLNVIANLLDPASLLTAVEGQICSLVTSTWNQMLGTAQCGLTVTGFNLGFFGAGGLGGGSLCPTLSFGGGGPPIGTLGVGANGSGSATLNGTPVAPTGYALPATGGLW